MNNNNRRKTLGILSPGQLNSRLSLGPSRVIKEGKPGQKATGTAGRPSLAGNLRGPVTGNSRLSTAAVGVPRRSSTYNGKSSSIKQDPRPIGDKAYQRNCARAIVAYLTAHNYDRPISEKVLLSPTKKDFEGVVQFLLRQLDPGCRLVGKLEDEIPQLFNWMKYPYQISKSALFAVGAPHTWPTLLAALNWLVEMLNYAAKAEAARDEAFDERQRGEADFFEYVSKSYRFFLAGDDYQCEQVDAEKTAEFDVRGEDLRKDVDTLKQGNAALQGQLEALAAQPNSLLAAQAKKEETQNDQQKFKKLIENLTDHKKKLEQKVKEKAEDLKAKQERRAALEAEIAALRQRLSTQTVNRDDVVRMTNEKAKQAEILRAAAGQREAVEGRVREAEVALERRLGEVEAAVQAYHTAADRLQLIPATAKRAGGVAFEARLDRTAAAAADLLAVDLKGVVKPALVRVREGYAGRARELAQELLSCQEALDAGLDGLTERTEENLLLAAEVGKLEQALRSRKAGLEMDLQERAAQAEQVRQRVAELKSTASCSIADSEERVRSLRSEYEDIRVACEVEREVLAGEVDAVLGLVVNHKIHLQQQLEEVRDAMLTIRDAVAAL